ncbi:TPA: hypothetical protein ACGCO1_003016, partial [Legionella pneumophila]
TGMSRNLSRGSATIEEIIHVHLEMGRLLNTLLPLINIKSTHCTITIPVHTNQTIVTFSGIVKLMNPG